MAEFVDVLRQFDRMCWYYQCKRQCPMGCPMNGVNISQCRKVAFEQPEVTEKTVMAWAAEHPEPVYPTWYEYLCKINVIPGYLGDKMLGQLVIERLMSQHIHADIAQKLGIEPKEG